MKYIYIYIFFFPCKRATNTWLFNPYNLLQLFCCYIKPAVDDTWQPTPVFLPGESHGRGGLVGCRPWGRTESDTTDATAAAAQSSTILLNLHIPSWGIGLQA